MENLVDVSIEVGSGTVLASGSSKDWTLQALTDGEVREWFVARGDAVKGGQPIADFQPRALLVVAEVSPELLFRFYSKPSSVLVKLDHGPAPFDCPFVSIERLSAGPTQLVCAIGDDVRAFPGVTAKVAAVTGEAKDVVILPLEAVAGEADRGYVTVFADGTRQRRDVTLGITDGLNVEVRLGLQPGVEVAIPPVDAP